jgi:hypothetical protein
MGIRIWLDDNRPAPDGWKWAHNVEEAQVMLLHRQADELSLDHDLDNPDCLTCNFHCGHQDDGKCEHGCQCHSNGDIKGLDLVKWMVKWNIWPKRKPVVHSTNGQHGEEMKALIEQNFPR